MSEKRRDSKNRILRSGESQRKDGRYAYKYTDTFGKPQFVYAWKLVSTDKTPAGKRDDISLREKVKTINKDLDDGIDTIGKKMTVCQLYAKHIRHNGNVKHGTKRKRKRLMELLEQDKLGSCSIDNVKKSDAKEWVLRMSEKGYAFSTIRIAKRSLTAAFHTAVEDDCIRKNPFDFKVNTVIEDNTSPNEALTQAQEKELLDFVRGDTIYRKYYDELIILLGTGLRISEFCGLTDDDIDFENRTINVDHQLIYATKIGRYIETPKTESGIRQIPMSDSVYEALQNVLKNRRSANPINIDGYSNFLFIGQTGNPRISIDYNKVFNGIVKKYNKCRTVALPRKTTPHTFRHTFCTNKANAGMNPKALQYIMGHANVSITLDYYAHASFESAQAEMDRLAA